MTHNEPITNIINSLNDLTQQMPIQPEQANDTTQNLWIDAAQYAMNDAQRIITALANKTAQQHHRAETATALLDHSHGYMQRHLPHTETCQNSEHAYPDVTTETLQCSTCILLTLIRHWIDDTTPQLTVNDIDASVPNA